MVGTGERGDAEERDGRASVPGEATVPVGNSSPRDPGQLAIDDLMRALSRERPRSVVAKLFGVSPIGPENEQRFARALGESAVGEILAQLGTEWSVLHSISVGREGARLDHLVVGPAGVFTVTTRCHPGVDVATAGRTVLVGGIKVAHVRDAEHDLGWAERSLSAALGESLTVTGLLVFVRPVSLAAHSVSKDVHVLPSGELLSWITGHADVFDDSEVQRVVSVAMLPATWGAPAGVELASDAAQLKSLVRQMERSRAIRQLWVGVAVIVFVVTATAIVTITIIGVAPGGVAH
ncbi:MAG: nuclease-related domain-containing protein [Lacisediminihabitans sp.]